MTFYTVQPSSLTGTISAPPSKSHTLRAILFATLASGTSVIRCYLASPDVEAMLLACQRLGAQISQYPDRIEIVGTAGQLQLPDDVIDAGNSGQVLRFVGALTALLDGHVVLTGDHSIRHNRPLAPLIEGLSGLGVQCISTKGDGHAPLIVKGPLRAGVTTLQGEDSQPVSALLMACAFAKGASDIIVRDPGEKPWVGLTLSWFDKLGISYHNDNFTNYRVVGDARINAFDYTVAGDFSSLAYPLVAALITNSKLTINNVDMQDPQGDKKLIEVLILMGAEIIIESNCLHVLPSGQLEGCKIDVNDFIDALPLLAVLACFAKGKTLLTNAAVARTKESDRLETISGELKKMGADIEVHNDSLVIRRAILQGARMTSHTDHRIAMSLFVAACAAVGPSVIDNVDCIAKSYPHFYTEMKALGCVIESGS